MDGSVVTSPHDVLNPESLPRPRGFAHAVASAPGRTIFVGGQAAHNRAGEIESDDLAEQFARACANVVRALDAAGARPEHLVQIHIFVTDAHEYRSRLKEVGDAYRRHLGSHYPAIALVEVAGLFDPRAKVELTSIAVVPS